MKLPKIKELTFNQAIKLLLIIFFINIIIVYGYSLITREYWRADFTSFYAAAQILIKEPKKLYDLSTQQKYQAMLIPDQFDQVVYDSPLPFQNPPIWLLLITIFTAFPITTAYYLFMLFNIGILLFCLFWLFKLFPPPKHGWLILLICISFAPVYFTLALNQNALITLCLFIIVYILLINQKLFLAGLVSSLLTYKPQFGIIVFAFLLLTKRKRAYQGLVVGLLLILTISWVMTRGVLVQLPHIIIEFVKRGAFFHNAISWLGFFTHSHYLFPQIPVNLLTIIASLTTLGVSWITIHKIIIKKSAFPMIFNLIIICTLLVGYHVHEVEAVLLIFVLFSFYYHHPELKVIVFAFLGWIVYFLLVFPGLTPFYPEPPFFIGTIYLVIILIFTIREIKLIK